MKRFQNVYQRKAPSRSEWLPILCPLADCGVVIPLALQYDEPRDICLEELDAVASLCGGPGVWSYRSDAANNAESYLVCINLKRLSLLNSANDCRTPLPRTSFRNLLRLFRLILARLGNNSILAAPKKIEYLTATIHRL